MAFKNARIYSVEITPELQEIFRNETRLEECITSVRFRPAGAQEMSSCGFSPVFGRHTDSYTFTSSGSHFFRFTEENKLMPSSVVNERLLDIIDQKEAELSRSLKKNEKQALKQALVDEMMSKAFASRRDLFIMVNSVEGFIAISATSAKRADNAITMLRKAFGTFPAKTLQPRVVVEDRMTNFIAKDDLPEGINLGYDCVLKSDDDTGATVKATKEDLTCKEILSHIEAGKHITELQLELVDQATFVLNTELTLKRITLDDQYLEKNLPQKTDDKVADMQSFMLVEADVIKSMVKSVMQAFDCASQG